MELQFRKEQYLKRRYQKIANQILALISTPEGLKQEVKLSCYGLWRIYHHLDLELDHIKTILETDNGTKERSRRPRCNSCEDVRPTSPTF